VPGRQPLLTGLSLALLGGRAAGVSVIDGVWMDVKDTEGLRAECLQGRQMGFDGKTLIHPGQIEVCNEVFAPSAEQVEDARGIIAAFDAAVAEGKGVATYKGKLVESLHVDTARKVLATAEAIDALG
jgi:citrate lyase subunit beta/citryl-CoA lyase